MGTLANPATPVNELAVPDTPLLPTRLRQGDTWNFNISWEDYPSTLYALQLIFNSQSNRFVLAGSGAGSPISADGDDQSFDVQATSAQTNLCVADTYQVVAVLAGMSGTTAAGQQITLPLQNVTVDPNFAAATGPIDTRSFVKKTLDMIEAAIAGNADPSVQEYMIQGRQLRRFDPVQLTKLRAIYKSLYKAELRASGEYAPPRKIGFRFNRAF